VTKQLSSRQLTR